MQAQELNDLYLRSLCLWREARGTSREALTAINAVIQNRMEDAKGRWPKTATEVILQPLQFSSFNPGDPNATKLPNPKQPGDWIAWGLCVAIASAPLESDPTGGATNYHSLPAGSLPAWADPQKLTAKIGAFRFYKL
jgi:N-acetylmuramoyl-L-alanine amidase